jgi:hypothetical protein
MIPDRLDCDIKFARYLASRSFQVPASTTDGCVS